MLLSIHGSPCKLGRLQFIVKVMLALGVDEQEHLMNNGNGSRRDLETKTSVYNQD